MSDSGTGPGKMQMKWEYFILPQSEKKLKIQKDWQKDTGTNLKEHPVTKAETSTKICNIVLYYNSKYKVNVPKFIPIKTND